MELLLKLNETDPEMVELYTDTGPKNYVWGLVSVDMIHELGCSTEDVMEQRIKLVVKPA